MRNANIAAKAEFADSSQTSAEALPRNTWQRARRRSLLPARGTVQSTEAGEGLVVSRGIGMLAEQDL
jgi:hypothetical protein